jgi:putative membrane protein
MRDSCDGSHNGVMTIPLLIPLEGGFGHHYHGPPGGAGEPSSTFASGAVPHFAPFLGGLMFFLFMLLVLGTLVYFLVRHGQFGAHSWAGRSPEGEAKKILAERFARGDITSDEFMERASVLNWTPGSDSWGDRKGKKGRL